VQRNAFFEYNKKANTLIINYKVSIDSA